MKALIAFIGCAALVAAWAREILEFGAARRENRLTRANYLRIRRRSLGFFLLAVLIGMVYFTTNVEAALQTQLKPLMAWYGSCLMIAIWLMIVAARDFRATILAAVDENRAATLASVEGLESAIAKAKSEERAAIAASSAPRKHHRRKK